MGSHSFMPLRTDSEVPINRDGAVFSGGGGASGARACFPSLLVSAAAETPAMALLLTTLLPLNA